MEETQEVEEEAQEWESSRGAGDGIGGRIRRKELDSFPVKCSHLRTLFDASHLGSAAYCLCKHLLLPHTVQIAQQDPVPCIAEPGFGQQLSALHKHRDPGLLGHSHLTQASVLHLTGEEERVTQDPIISELAHILKKMLL